MALYHFHRVLIAASIVFDVWFSYWCWQAWARTQEGTYIALMIGSTVLVAVMVVYLVYFNRKTRQLRHAVEITCDHCSYDLRGTIAAGQGKCPECGAAISDLTVKEYRMIAG